MSNGMEIFARRSLRIRRLWDAYYGPGMRIASLAFGRNRRFFGDPKARVIRLSQRSTACACTASRDFLILFNKSHAAPRSTEQRKLTATLAHSSGEWIASD